MASVSIDAHEVRDLADDILRHAATTNDLAERAVAKVGHDMQATAMANAPVDTGLLKSSISIDVMGLGFDLGPTAEYGGYVELGTHGPYPIHDAFGWGITVMHPGNAPEPYLGPAFDAHLPDLERALGAIGDAVISRA